ncbi:MAG TPA: hypothetical protein VE326_11535 [Candidatus Binatia bacterium]|nr:hypothetical protein [Candidatus Binatia bacterium]
MSDGVFNVAKGALRFYAGLPAANDALVAVLLKAGVESDAILTDHLSLASALAANAECDFTNYARMTLTGVVTNEDDAADAVAFDANDFTYVAAGGASNNDVAKLLLCYVPDTTAPSDAATVPLTYHDCVFTTDGTNVTVQLAAAGFARAQ